MEITEFVTSPLVLEIPEALQEAAWTVHLQQTTSLESTIPDNEAPDSDRYRNYIHQLCQDTLLAWLQEEGASVEVEPIALEPTAVSAVPGVSFLLRSATGTLQRLVAIPAMELGLSDFRIPQAWVDGGERCGDYFFAVQVNLEGDALQVLGYTTAGKLQANAHYDGDDRCYVVPRVNLITDLAVFWTARELCPEESLQVAQDPVQDPVQASVQASIQTLVPTPIPTLIPTLIPTPTPTSTVNLGDWINERFTETWEAIETWLTGPELAMAFRKVSDTESTNIRRAKSLEIPGWADRLLLLLSLTREVDGRTRVRVRLFAASPVQTLPEAIELVMLSSQGDVVQSVRSRPDDSYIQLKSFRCVPGTQFAIQVSVPGWSFVEQFVG